MPDPIATTKLGTPITEERADEQRHDRAATRWLARFALERPSARLEDLQLLLHALEALPYNEPAARQTLAALCEAHGLRRVVDALGC